VIVLDLALQGIHDLVGSTRVRLQSGYTALVTPQVKPDTLVTGLCELLFAEGFDPSASGLAAPGARSTGGGVTLMAGDGATFRIMRDLVVGSAQLLEFDRETKAFAEVATAAAEISQFLRARVGLPTRQTFESVFLLRQRDLPSVEEVPEIETPEVPAEPEPEKPDPEVLKTRLAEIERTLAGLEKIEALEFELDGLQKQRFTAEDKLRGMTFDQSDLEEARVAVRRFAYLDSLPETFGARFDAYIKLVEKRDSDMKRWQEEREKLDRGEERTRDVDPLLRDWRLWTGLGVGALAVAAGAVLGGVFRYAALLDIPAFGLAAVLIYQNLSQREQRDRALLKTRVSDRRRVLILERDAEEITAIEAIIKALNLESADEVRRALAGHKQANAHLQHLTAEAEAAANDPELQQVKKSVEEATNRANDLEAELATLSSVPVDNLALRSEANFLRDQLAGLEPEPEPEPEAAEPEPVVSPMGDSWMTAALDLLLTDPHSAAKTLSERASLLVRALSENRLSGVIIEPTGAVAIRSAAGDDPVPWDRMPPAAQDLAYLALRGGLFLAVDQRVRAPFVSGDIGSSVAAGLAVTQTLLTTLGHGGQVIHLVRRGDQAPGAKHVSQVELT